MAQIDNTVAYPANGPDAAQFRRLSSGYTNAQVGTTYTLVAADNGVTITFNNPSPITVTVPSGLGENFWCNLVQIGAGQVTIAAGAGATVNSYGQQKKLVGQYADAGLWAYSADTFHLSGLLTA